MVCRVQVLLLLIALNVSGEELRLKVITVATEETDGLKRFLRSVNIYGLDVEVLGLNDEWHGGNLQTSPGGGQKINILSTGLKKYKDEKDLLLMFTDAYDVVFNSGAEEIIKRFLKFNSSILISAEDFCWPDQTLVSKYPAVDNGYKYLCSGGIIGYAGAVYNIITLKEVKDNDDDQLYYTKIYLDDREKYNIKLDQKAELFQNLNGAQHDVELRFEGDAYLHNTRFDTNPVVIHGNGPSKTFLNHLANYLSKSWSYSEGCKQCSEVSLSLDDIPRDDWPTVLIGLFIDQPTPFVNSFLQYISNLDYPKKKIHIFLHNTVPYHSQQTRDWLNKFQDEYRSVIFIGPENDFSQVDGRNKCLQHCNEVGCDYFFSVDAKITLSNSDTLKLLIEQNRTFIAPLVSKTGKLWSNFWGAISGDGYYERSSDYIDIVKQARKGTWNVPYIARVYLIKAETLASMIEEPFVYGNHDLSMSFSKNARDKGIFMFVTNMHEFGHEKELKTYSTQYKHNDLYQMFENRLDWENRYLHPDYYNFLDIHSKPIEPCPDVYWFPLVTKNFTRELVEEVENYGKWSGGGNTRAKDERLAGGYENVPTVDIHLNQVGLDETWMQMIRDYISPMAERYYTGYDTESRSIMNFVVKYSTNGQYYLRPHHDASTFTINMALNSVDQYEGGGCRFTRYNCSVTKTKEGWSLMSPGRLTHQHEGLPLLKGLRYIMVSFIDP